MSDVTEKLQERLNYEWRQLRQPTEWVPAMVSVGGYKALDIERLDDDMGRSEWGYYRAGLIQGYGRALRELEKQDDGEDKTHPSTAENRQS